MRGALAVLVLFLACGRAEAEGDRIWSALVLATKETPVRDPSRFGEVRRHDTEDFRLQQSLSPRRKETRSVSGGEEWLVPSKEFFFRVQSLSRDATFYTLRIELYRDKNLLLTTEAKLAKNAPLYIRGPEWGSGQLILLLEVR